MINIKVNDMSGEYTDASVRIAGNGDEICMEIAIAMATIVGDALESKGADAAAIVIGTIVDHFDSIVKAEHGVSFFGDIDETEDDLPWEKAYDSVDRLTEKIAAEMKEKGFMF